MKLVKNTADRGQYGAVADYAPRMRIKHGKQMKMLNYIYIYDNRANKLIYKCMQKIHRNIFSSSWI